MSSVVICRILLCFCFATLAFARIEVTIPGEGGSISIENLRFLRPNGYGDTSPELSFSVTNKTAFSWETLKLQVDIGGLCNGQTRQWSRMVLIGLGWTRDTAFTKQVKDVVLPL